MSWNGVHSIDSIMQLPLLNTEPNDGVELVEMEQKPKPPPLCETCRTARNFAITINLNEETIVVLMILIAVVLLLR